MNELSRHIERLLLAHDCIVVPQFGGFVTMATYATREETEGLFFPPIRVVRFNPDLMEDDGWLLADVREQRRCSESEAKRHIQHLVLNLRQQLLADGQADFGSIGLFTQDEDGRVSFSPCQAGVITPAYFGLDAFAMPKLTAAQRSGKHRTAQQQALEEEQRNSSSHITIRISRRGLKNALTAAAIIVLCALFSSPVDDARQSNQATLLPSTPAVEVAHPAPSAEARSTVSPSNSSPAAQSVPAASEQPAAPAPVPSAEERSTVSPSNSSPAVQSAPAAKYCIVLASDVSLKNADRYVKLLQERGFTDARIYNNGKMNRVVLGNFQTENEAYNMNAKLHRTSTEYASTWVLAL